MVTAVNPNQGPVTGLFEPVDDTELGGQIRKCADVISISPTELTCLTPPDATLRIVGVIVTNGVGSSTLTDGHKYDCVPTITNISLPQGSTVVDRGASLCTGVEGHSFKSQVSVAFEVQISQDDFAVKILSEYCQRIRRRLIAIKKPKM